MSHLWIICFKFNVAIALASLGLFCFDLPATASETHRQRSENSFPLVSRPASTSTPTQDALVLPIEPLLRQANLTNLAQAAPTDSVKLKDVLPSDTEPASPAAAPTPAKSTPAKPTPQSDTGQPESMPKPSAPSTGNLNEVPPQTPNAPLSAPADANSISAPQVGDAERLKQLSPNPNPLLIQTDPKEVEISDTQQITLEEAIDLAYGNNPDLQSALLELKRSQAGLREAKAALFPTLGRSARD